LSRYHDYRKCFLCTSSFYFVTLIASFQVSRRDSTLCPKKENTSILCMTLTSLDIPIGTRHRDNSKNRKIAKYLSNTNTSLTGDDVTVASRKKCRLQKISIDCLFRTSSMDFTFTDSSWPVAVSDSVLRATKSSRFSRAQWYVHSYSASVTV